MYLGCLEKTEPTEGRQPREEGAPKSSVRWPEEMSRSDPVTKESPFWVIDQPLVVILQSLNILVRNWLLV